MINEFYRYIYHIIFCEFSYLPEKNHNVYLQTDPGRVRVLPGPAQNDISVSRFVHHQS